VPPVDGECDRLRFGRRSGRQRRHRQPRESGADVQGPLADRLHLRGVAEREELFKKRTSATIRQGAHLGEGAFILRRAAVGHNLCDRSDGPARRHAASAGTKTGGPNLHDAKQRRQPPGTDVLERALRATVLAATSASAMFLCLRLDQMALQPGQRLLALRHRQAERLCRIDGRRALAEADRTQLYGTLRSAKFHHARHFISPSRPSTSRPVHSPQVGPAGANRCRVLRASVRFVGQLSHPHVLDGLNRNAAKSLIDRILLKVA
jgi:hypothetical protein